MSAIRNLIDWVKKDYESHPVRLVMELIAWACSMTAALWLALTTPTPPLHYLYPIWLVNCTLFAWASWTRGSFGLLANYILIIIIDLVGVLRTFGII